MANKNFEQNVKEKMDGFKLHPSEAVWLKIDAQLRKDKRRRWFFFLLFTGALLGIGTLVGYQYNQQSKVQQPVAIQQPPSNQTSTNAEIIAAPPASVNQLNPSSSNPSTISVKTSARIVQQLQRSSTAYKKKESSSAPSTIQKQEVIVVAKEDGVKNETEMMVKQAPVTETTKQTPLPVETKQAPVSNATKQVADSITTIDKKEPAIKTTEEKKEVMADTVATTPSSQKRKPQKGWSINAGMADVRSSFFPSSGFETRDANAIPFTGTAGTPGGISGFIIYEYNIKGKMQAGIGYGMRFPLWKQSWFATGIQYQYSSFNVIERTRRDTFSAIQNRLVNDFTNETKTNYSFHYLSIPAELQLHIAGTVTNSVKLNVGMQHQFRLASTSALPAFARDSSAPAFLRSSHSAAAFYQPIIHIAPAYEWKTKKGLMQLGWYVNYALSPVYKNTERNNWWQTGLRLQFWFTKK